MRNRHPRGCSAIFNTFQKLMTPLRIGTLAGKGPRTAEYIRAINVHGFESFQINFWQQLKGTDLGQLAIDVREALAGSDAIISSLGINKNPLGTEAIDLETRRIWEEMIDRAHEFGTNLVCGFTGRVPDKSIPDSLPRFK